MDKIGKLTTKSICYILLSIFIEFRFLNVLSSNITGICIAILMIYLYVFCDSNLEIIVIIIIANDALGTIFFGHISFQYLLFILLIYTLVFNRKLFIVNKKDILVDLLAVFSCLELYFVGFIEIKLVLFTILYYYAFVINIRLIPDKDIFINRFTFAMSLICTLIALHACITGGVIYNEYDATEAYYIRKGLLGVGIGDPNFSSLLICFGIISTFMHTRFNHIYIVVSVCILIRALIITMSTTGIIGVIFVFILLLFINKTLPKKIRNIVIVLCGFILIIILYNSLSTSVKIPAIDMYIERVVSKIDALTSGQWNMVTSGRSTLVDEYWYYIKNEDVMRLLFGFNTLNCAADHVPHNTYIDFILQFGIIGVIFFLVILLYRARTILHNKEQAEYRKVLIIYKLVFIFYLGTLSLYQGSLYALMMVVLFVL